MSSNRTTADNLEARFESGEDVMDYFDLSKASRPLLKKERVNLDIPHWMVVRIDRIASRKGVAHGGDVFVGVLVGEYLRPSAPSAVTGFGLLQQHGNNFAQVAPKFVERLRLGMCAGKSGHVAHQQPGVLVTFDNRGETVHSRVKEILLAEGLQLFSSAMANLQVRAAGYPSRPRRAAQGTGTA